MTRLTDEMPPAPLIDQRPDELCEMQVCAWCLELLAEDDPGHEQKDVTETKIVICRICHEANIRFVS